MLGCVQKSTHRRRIAFDCPIGIKEAKESKDLFILICQFENYLVRVDFRMNLAVSGKKLKNDYVDWL